MIKTTIAPLLALIAAVVLYAASRPDHFRIERSITVNASPDRIFPLVSNFHQWEAWSPWEKIDPNLSRTYSGATEGKGAVYAWSGNKDIGQGRMEIIESQPSSKLRIQLDFITPFEAHNTVDIVLTPKGNTTVVTQSMQGPSPFISKLMGLVFSIDKMVGGKYEEGLASLKVLAEKPVP
jgi:uncharacterized protein YndB with AHSA1/START domain